MQRYEFFLTWQYLFLSSAIFFVLLHLHKVDKMKRTWTIILGLVLLASCNNKGQENGIDNFAWYDSVFSKAEYDTTTVVPDYAFSTDWMQRYVQYIKDNFENRGGDIWFSNDTAEGFDCRYWTMAYVDDDTIPELLLYGGCNASASVILTQHNGEVYPSPRGAFSYIKGGGGLLHSQFRYADETWGGVYEMKDGQFVEKCDYCCSSAFIDTNDIADYGLNKEELSRYQIGNGTVGVNEIKLNGERIGTYYGYNQWPSCPAFGKVKQTLDSLYYSKGTSTYFPIPSESMTIGNMINAEK